MKKQFADRLAEGMKARNMTAAELSRLSGVDKGSISRYLSGERNNPTTDRIGALTVCAALGLRPAETFALRKDDVDLIARTVSVGYRVGTGEDTITGTLIGPKTEGSLRTLPLPEQLLSVFQRIARMQDSDFLFAKWDGSLWSSRSRSGYIRSACRKAGIEFTSYQLRHQFSTDLVTAGVDLRTVQELMGHASGTMTLSYARSNDRLKREAIEERMQTAKA